MVSWPNGHRFAFTVFDDTDRMTLQNGPAVYDLLGELDMRITKSVWMTDAGRRRTTGGSSCDDPIYLDWVLGLQDAGHEIGYHLASDSSSPRAVSLEALDRFERVFGHPPRVGADHAGNRDCLYSGERRVSGPRRAIYRQVVRLAQPTRPRFSGAEPSSPYFWGDLAQQRIDYWRRFTFAATDLLSTGPGVYRDPATPYVNAWFDSGHAPRLLSLLERLHPSNLERLEQDGGLCVLYTHFGVDSLDRHGRPDPRLVRALRRLRELDGWFAPVSEVLDHVVHERGMVELDRRSGARHQNRWILDRLRAGSRLGPKVQTHHEVM